MTPASTELISWAITGVAIDLGQVPLSDHSSKFSQPNRHKPRWLVEAEECSEEIQRIRMFQKVNE